MGKRYKVAIVDDSEIVLAWAKRSLDAAGFDVVTYSAGLGIQAFVRAAGPDLLLLDVNMPALRGDMVCRMLKAKVETASVIVVLFSSLSDAELTERVKTCDADGYITKTNDSDEFLKRIKFILRRAGEKA